LAGIIKQALGKTKPGSLLSEAEWFRMARFYYQKMTLLKPLSFCMLLSDSQVLYDQVVLMQLFKNDAKQAKPFIQILQKYSSKEAVCKASKLTQKRVYHRAAIEVEVLYDSPKLYKWMQSFIKAINAHSTEFDSLLMECMFA
jgi:hypothetical protein